MAFIRNTSPVLWSPTGDWSALPTHGELLDGGNLVIRRPIALVDEDGTAVTSAPGAAKSVILPAGSSTEGINLSSPWGEFDRDRWKVIMEAYWIGKSLALRLLADNSGTVITGGGYADQMIAAWTVVR